MAGKRKILVVEVGQGQQGSILYATSVNPSLKPQKVSDVSYQGQKTHTSSLACRPVPFCRSRRVRKRWIPLMVELFPEQGVSGGEEWVSEGRTPCGGKGSSSLRAQVRHDFHEAHGKIICLKGVLLIVARGQSANGMNGWEQPCSE